jgi:hypothetical protein
MMQYTLWNKSESCSLSTNETGKLIFDLIDGKRSFSEILNKLISSAGYSSIVEERRAQLDELMEITTIFFDLSRVLIQFWLSGHIYLVISEKAKDKTTNGQSKPNGQAELLKRLSRHETLNKQAIIFQKNLLKDKEQSFHLKLIEIRNMMETNLLIPVHAS